MTKKRNLNQLKVGNRFKIAGSFNVLGAKRKVEPRKYYVSKVYTVEEVKNDGVQVNYMLYDGKVKLGTTSETIGFNANKDLRVNLV